MKLPIVKSPFVKTLLAMFVLGLAAACAVGPDSAAEPTGEPAPGRLTETLVTLSGTVTSVPSSRQFELDYGERSVTVDMSGFEPDVFDLRQGDKVLVTGFVDDELLVSRFLEATSLHIERLHTAFYAQPLDQETMPAIMQFPVIAEGTIVSGRVTEIRNGEFSIDTGLREIIVDVREMANDPLDDEGYQKVEVGDYVSVTGGFYTDIFADRQLEAEGIVTIEHGKPKR
ncbi:MAG: S1 RNA-binding domain-containing protein [Wenzhouxiangellaceae bacterium]|nr:S1 RNA-binding domain-containing protein [Wenzhouxiangellaceae bacterium]